MTIYVTLNASFDDVYDWKETQETAGEVNSVKAYIKIIKIFLLEFSSDVDTDLSEV
jgi:hypothetical protein